MHSATQTQPAHEGGQLAATHGQKTAHLLQFASAAFLAAYFVYFAFAGLRGRFALDDLANMAYYFHRGTWSLILAQFEFCSTYLRPMGGLFYMPIFHFAGFNPLPYRVAGLLIIGANIILFYVFAKLLTGSKGTAWLAALLVSYHPHLSDMIYSNAVIYDVLCFSFYFAALGWYLHIRVSGRLLNWRETAVFFLLYICALNSKEMTVSLPVTLALYELLYHPPAGLRPRALGEWLKAEGRVVVIAGVVTAAYVAGKTLGADPLIAIDAYRPEITLHRFMQSVSDNIRSMFYLPGSFPQKFLTLPAAALLLFAGLKRSRFIAFCVLFAISSELPIAFIARSWSCLYIPLGAWSLLVAATVWNASQFVARAVVPRRAQEAVAVALVLVTVLSYAAHARREKNFLQPLLLQSQDKTWSAIQEFSKFKYKPPPRASLAFLNDPFDDWDMEFVAELWFRDPTLHQTLLRKTPLPPANVAAMDYIYDYRDGKFIQVKP